ncbi:class I SAM-dependent methyltransferase [Chryseobacterium tructae]|uniref:Class I SAM-dependent methyltransferase n=1 Tax=Chryseobacterium tructae TaxID=1037380 RepID=A0ABV7XQA9_9FLAO|nr:class I SAM-dependent methyltransferase [Chryseobacterium tructae]MDN3690879.1 class I SAM-dependent methyltransferase [Chryseobacterium tructae]
MAKVNKFLSFFRTILETPSLINLVLDSSLEAEKKFKKKYTGISSLPQIDMKLLGDKVAEDIDSFILDGGSLITDLQLLKTLSMRNDVNSYIEIGTWRGESVYNVAKYTEDCTTINLSKKEMKEMGLHVKYAEQHGILSQKNPQINHLEANTKFFDFTSLGKKYDLVFIDGDHSYEMVLNDTKKVFDNLLHENSIVVWHDYAYNPLKIRYEVFQAILDGVGKENHGYLYHPQNTMCAIFIKGKFPTTPFDDKAAPTKILNVKIHSEEFSS